MSNLSKYQRWASENPMRETCKPLGTTPKAVLSRDVEIMFRDDYPVKAKAGTRLHLVRGASGTAGDLWSIPPHACDAGPMGGKNSIFAHDSKHFYIWAPLDAVEVIE